MKNFVGTHICIVHLRAKIRNEKKFPALCTKKDKMSGQNRSKNTFLKTLISFLHRAQGMSFHFEKIHECEQLICVSSIFFRIFHNVLLFFYFVEKNRSM